MDIEKLGLRRRLALEIWRYLEDDMVKHHPLRQLFWECTLRCNLNCRHCGSDCKNVATQPDMPIDDFLGVLEDPQKKICMKMPLLLPQSKILHHIFHLSQKPFKLYVT